MKKSHTTPKRESYRPTGTKQTTFISILEGWHGVSFADPFDKGSPTISRIIGPDKKVYRYAYGWEQPDIAIVAEVFPPEMREIRLVRERNKALRVLVKRRLRERLKRART